MSSFTSLNSNCATMTMVMLHNCTCKTRTLVITSKTHHLGTTNSVVAMPDKSFIVRELTMPFSGTANDRGNGGNLPRSANSFDTLRVSLPLRNLHNVAINHTIANDDNKQELLKPQYHQNSTVTVNSIRCLVKAENKHVNIGLVTIKNTT